MKKTKNVTASFRREDSIAGFAAARFRAHAVILCFLLATPCSLQAAPQPIPLPPQPIDDPPVYYDERAPAATNGAQEIAPTVDTDVSTLIATGGGYDAYTGSVRRFITDLVVPGAVSANGLNFTRTYSSALPYSSGWSFAFNWAIEGRPSIGDGLLVTFPDGRILKFQGPRSSQTGETAWRTAAGTNERLFRYNTNQYIGTVDLVLEDGTLIHFDRETDLSNSDSYLIDYFTRTYMLDPYGQKTTFGYEQIPGTFDPHKIRLKTVTDPSGRTLTLSYDPNMNELTRVTASNGQWVQYIWTSVDFGSGYGTRREITGVNYSDATSASYTYVLTNVTMLDGTTGRLPKLATAQDTRASGPMSAIKYEYAPIVPEKFQGELKAERHFGDDLLVSAFAHNSGRTLSTDTRGDGPMRSFNMQLVQGVPLVTSKSDFYGRLEYYFYDANNYLRQINNRRGYVTTYTNEPILGRPTQITHYDGPTVTGIVKYEYTDLSNPYYVKSRTDENLKKTIYTRNAVTHKVERIDYPDNGWEEFTYNNFGEVLTHKRTNGVYTAYDHFAYDTTGRLVKHWEPTPSASYPPPDNYPHTTFNYYSSGDVWEWADRISSIIDAMGRTTTYEYDRGPDGVQRAGRGFVTRIQYWSDTHDGAYPTGTSQSFGYDAFGDKLWESDELTHTTNYAYDDYKRLIRVTNPLNQFTDHSYAPPNGAGSYSHTTSSVYRTTSAMGKKVDFDYDRDFRRTMVRKGAESADDDGGSYYGYDAVGNMTSATDPRGKVTTYGYNDRNRQTSVKNNELNETTTFEYDSAGNKKKEIRQDTTFRSWDYDAMNRLWHVYDWRLSDPPSASETTTYGRDIAGNVRSITDTKGAIYEYNYDLKNLKISETYPLDATGVSRSYAYHYDYVGNLDYFINPAGQAKNILFDARNRPRHSWWNDGVGQDVQTHYDRAGRTSDVTTNGGETIVAFGYDDANRKIWEDQTLTGYPTRHVQTDPDADGNRITLEVPGWYSVRYDYTKRNQLAHILGGNWLPWFNYSYDVSGNMIKRQDVLGGVNDSTNCPSANYDALNRPTMWEQTKAGDAAFARSWQKYDTVNREVATWRDEQSSKGEHFTYNPMGQLTDVSYNADQVWNWNGNPINSTRNVNYVYSPDKLNRTSTTDNGTVTTYSPNSLNQYQSVAGISYSYDNNFNLANTEGFSARYDASNHLVSVYLAGNSVSGASAPSLAGDESPSAPSWIPEEIARFLYDGLGRCVRRTVQGAETLITYDGWKPIVEWDHWGNFQAWNIYGPGPDEILYRYSNSYGHLRYHLDRMGHVAFLLDNNGTVREKYTYDAFGLPAISDADGGNPRSSSWYGNRFMFAGREWIPELHLYDYRNRFYHPLLGRFLQADPKGFDAGDMNLFRYVGDDPVDKTDPTGLTPPSLRLYNQSFSTPIGMLEERLRPFNMALTIIISGLGPGQKENSDSKWSNRQFYDAAKATDPNNSRLFRRDQKQEMMKAIAEARAKGDHVLNIFGYSRGAVAGVQLSQRLDKMGIGVDRLVTIDPIRVLPFGDGPGRFKVPDNVREAENYYQGLPHGGFLGFPSMRLNGNVQNHPLGGFTPNGTEVIHQNMPRVVSEIGGY
jgi:RHS repeat-associated protein